MIKLLDLHSIRFQRNKKKPYHLEIIEELVNKRVKIWHKIEYAPPIQSARYQSLISDP